MLNMQLHLMNAHLISRETIQNFKMQAHHVQLSLCYNFEDKNI